jgi:hypothetical protein
MRLNLKTFSNCTLTLKVVLLFLLFLFYLCNDLSGLKKSSSTVKQNNGKQHSALKMDFMKSFKSGKKYFSAQKQLYQREKKFLLCEDKISLSI